MEGKQHQQKLYHDNSYRIWQFNIGDKVYVQNFGQGQRWLPGQIQEVTGPVSFLIELVDWRPLRRHQDHVRIRKGNSESVLQPEEHEISVQQEETLIDALTPAADEITDLVPGQPGPSTSEDEIELPTSTDVTIFSPLPLKVYTKRNRKAPDWYQS